MSIRLHILHCFVCLLLLSALYSCRTDEVVLPPEEEKKGDVIKSEVVGFYLLNEGNMGSNKATLDYYDFSKAVYTRNIYSAANPEVPQSLGDVGNELKIYGSRLYAVINCSNLIEVMDATTAKHIGTINIPNCRYLAFKDGYGYISSYAGPVVVDASKAQIGYVAKFDTATLNIVDTCYVGFQPDELEIVNNMLYVANSGGYMKPNYENTLSVIDLTSFKELRRIPIAINLHRVRMDKYNYIWVSSRGDYEQIPSRLYCVDTKKNKVVDSVKIAVDNMWLDGDSLYVYSESFNTITMTNDISYHIVNTKTRKVIATKWFDDSSITIEKPYGVFVHPVTKDIFLADAKNFVEPGTLWCIGQDGKAKWSVRTGDIPGHFALLYKTTK